MRRKKEPLFKSEAELCAAFIEWSKKRAGWTAYAETEGWDILLAHQDGTQIGIQAKLKFNMAVLSQAIEDGYAWQKTGPDFRAVLVPEADYATLAYALGLTVIVARSGWSSRGAVAFEPDLDSRYSQVWHYANPEKRHTLPAYVPDVPAGAPAPMQLTQWKIRALQVCAVMELRGYLTRYDFRIAQVDHRRWVQEWLEPVPEQPGAWRWRDGRDPGFAKQHPVVYPQVLADVQERRWHLRPGLI